MKVKIGVSNRHVHFNEETYKKLFDEELTIKGELSQPGQYSCNQTVTIKGPRNEINNVRILGPLRNYNQVEVSHHDARELGINPPVRRSGDLNGAETITIIGPKGEITLENSCIIANRHLHISPEEAAKNLIEDNEKLTLVIPGEKSGTIDVYAKIQPDSITEVHLDTDDANAFLLNGNEELELIK